MHIEELYLFKVSLVDDSAGYSEEYSAGYSEEYSAGYSEEYSAGYNGQR